MSPETAPLTLEYLDRGRRFLALLLEVAIWTLALMVLALIIPEPFATAVGLIAYIAYRAYMVRRYGGTLGHLAAKGRVVSVYTGERPTLGQAISRAALSLLDLLIAPFLINIAMVLFRQDHRHLYDLIAGTAVVAQPDSGFPATQPTAMEPDA